MPGINSVEHRESLQRADAIEDDELRGIEVSLSMDLVDGKPVLVGVHVWPFGWILGGSRPGAVKLQGSMDVTNEFHELSANSDGTLLPEIRRAISGFDYVANGWKMLPIAEIGR